MELSTQDQQRRALAIAAISLTLFAIGWLIGSLGGADVDSARAAGAKAGAIAGTAAGKKTGYDDGYEKGDKTAYRAAYDKAYEAAGGDAD